MITKQQLIDACRHETEVVKHLASKVPEGQHGWRPTSGQRSTLELMRYMTVMSLIPSVYCVTGNWDHAPDMSAESEKVTPETFADAMDQQMSRIEEVLAEIDEEAATTKPAAMPWGDPTPQSACMMRTVYSTFVAYRMQLFLHAKQSGAPELGPFDCWAGKPPPEAP